MIGDYLRKLLAKFETCSFFPWKIRSDFRSILGSRRNVSEMEMPSPRLLGDERDQNSNFVLRLGTVQGSYCPSLRPVATFLGKSDLILEAFWVQEKCTRNGPPSPCLLGDERDQKLKLCFMIGDRNGHSLPFLNLDMNSAAN